MLVISTREFRDKQGMYLGRIKSGEDLIIKSRENGSFKIIPVTEDDTLMSKEDLFAKIDQARKEATEGKGKVIKSKEDLVAYFDSL